MVFAQRRRGAERRSNRRKPRIRVDRRLLVGIKANDARDAVRAEQMPFGVAAPCRGPGYHSRHLCVSASLRERDGSTVRIEEGEGKQVLGAAQATVAAEAA